MPWGFIHEVVVVGVKEKSRIALGTGGGASTVGCCGREGTARTDAISDGAPTETRQRAERSAVEPQVTAPDHAAHEEEHEEDVDDANERGQYDDDQRQYATDQQAKVREARQREKDQRFALQAMQHCGAAEATTHARRQLEAFERGRAAQPTTVGLAFHLYTQRYPHNHGVMRAKGGIGVALARTYGPALDPALIAE
mgnify:CR=1 FL=1